MPSRKPHPAKCRTQFGKCVAKLRVKAGLTQERAAESIGVSTRYFQDIEHGTYFPSLPVLLRLRKTLNAGWDALFEGCEG